MNDTTTVQLKTTTGIGRLVKKHFPPAQESETRSGLVPVSKLEALAKKWRVAPRNGLSDEAAALYFSTLLNAALDLEALITEILEKSEAK